jgi:hypothetical protein
MCCWIAADAFRQQKPEGNGLWPVQDGLPNLSSGAGSDVQRCCRRWFAWHCCCGSRKGWFVHLGVQMNRGGRLACPSCGQKYAALYFRQRSTCPNCRADVKTDLRTIGILETVIGAPCLWMAAVLLRTYLNDSTGVLSYALLFVPALAIHLFVIRRFVTAQEINSSS